MGGWTTHTSKNEDNLTTYPIRDIARDFNSKKNDVLELLRNGWQKLLWFLGSNVSWVVTSKLARMIWKAICIYFCFYASCMCQLAYKQSNHLLALHIYIVLLKLPSKCKLAKKIDTLTQNEFQINVLVCCLLLKNTALYPSSPCASWIIF
jgi:hypothetical protein